MTTILRTPKGWPSILLARAEPAGDVDARRRSRGRARQGGRGRRVQRPAGARSTTSGRRARSPTIAASGLRGRGGAGFPTGEKWRSAAETDAPRRYVVAQRLRRRPVGADRPDADRGATRTRVLEGVAIAAFAIGADEAIIAVRAEATDAIRRLEAAIGAAEDAGPHRARTCSAPGRGRRSDRPAGPGRLHARRGDGPPQGARGQARPAGAAAAAPRRARPVRHADRRPERPDPRRGRPGSSPTARRRSPRSARRRARARSSSASAVRRASGVAEVPLGTPLREIVALAGDGRRASRRSSSAGRRAGSCRPSCSTRPTSSTPCGPSAPTSARARSSPPTSAPASSTWPGS